MMSLALYHLILVTVLVSLTDLCRYLTIAENTRMSTGFPISPESRNATLNSTVSFSCKADIENAGYLWRLNGSLLEELTNEITVHSSLAMSTLGVYCSKHHDNLRIECGVLLANFSMVYSTPALLRIQGLLGPVINLTAETTISSIILNWVPPFSLDITGVEPDFTHTVEVYVYNITTCSTRKCLANTFQNITDSNFTFSTDLVYTDSSYLFEFIIKTVNSVGSGKPSLPLQERFSADGHVGVRSTVPTSTTSYKQSSAADNTETSLPESNSSSTLSEVPTTESGQLMMNSSSMADSGFISPLISTIVALGTLLGVTFVLLAVSIVGIFKLKLSKQSQKEPQHSVTQQPVKTETEDSVEMKSCVAYVTCTVTKQHAERRQEAVTMNQNVPVYEEIF